MDEEHSGPVAVGGVSPPSQYWPSWTEGSPGRFLHLLRCDKEPPQKCWLKLRSQWILSGEMNLNVAVKPRHDRKWHTLLSLSLSLHCLLLCHLYYFTCSYTNGDINTQYFQTRHQALPLSQMGWTSKILGTLCKTNPNMSHCVPYWDYWGAKSDRSTPWDSMHRGYES